MSINDDDRPVRKVAHEIGCDLSLLSVDELASRIDLLKAEIARLEDERRARAPAARRRRSCSVDLPASDCGRRVRQGGPDAVRVNRALSFISY